MMQALSDNINTISIVYTRHEVKAFTDFLKKSNIVTFKIPHYGDFKDRALAPRYIFMQSVHGIFIIDALLFAETEIDLSQKTILLDVRNNYEQFRNVFRSMPLKIVDTSLALAFNGESPIITQCGATNIADVESIMNVDGVKQNVSESIFALQNYEATLTHLGHKEPWYYDAILSAHRAFYNPFEDIMNHNELERLDAIRQIRKEISKQTNMLEESVIKSSTVIKIAIVNPKTFDELQNINGINKVFFSGAIARKILKSLHSLNKQGVDEISRIDLKNVNKYHFSILSALLHGVAKRKNILPELIANEDEITAFIFGSTNVDFLSGWKEEIFGCHAREVISGKIAVGCSGTNMHLVNMYA